MWHHLSSDQTPWKAGPPLDVLLRRASSLLARVCLHQVFCHWQLKGFSLKQIPNLRFSPSQTFPTVITHDKGAKVPLLREAPEDLETHKSLGSHCLRVIFQPRMDSRRLSWRKILKRTGTWMHLQPATERRSVCGGRAVLLRM